MKSNLKSIIITVCFAIAVFSLSLGTMLTPDKQFSGSERRRLAIKPSFSTDSLRSGEFFADSEKYLLDQVAGRDFFRAVKAFTVYNLLQQKDNNDIYLVDGMIGKLEYPLNVDSVEKAARHFNHLYSSWFGQQKAWLAVIPDKSYYLAAQNGYPAIDYGQVMEILADNLDSILLLEIFDQLAAADYYRTDIHWRQENLLPLASFLLRAMGSGDICPEPVYEENSLYPFRGSFWGQAALPLPADSLVYLDSNLLAAARAYDHEKQEWTTVYNPELFTGMDPYDVYLGGARSLITIYNQKASNDRELLIFRDSFASSLAPLLLPGYARITLVDLRYMQSDLLPEFIEFGQNQDILFLYSMQVLNNSAMLR